MKIISQPTIQITCKCNTIMEIIRDDVCYNRFVQNYYVCCPVCSEECDLDYSNRKGLGMVEL